MKTHRKHKVAQPVLTLLHSPPAHQVVMHSPPFLRPTSRLASTMWESNFLKMEQIKELPRTSFE